MKSSRLQFSQTQINGLRKEKREKTHGQAALGSPVENRRWGAGWLGSRHTIYIYETAKEYTILLETRDRKTSKIYREMVIQMQRAFRLPKRQSQRRLSLTSYIKMSTQRQTHHVTSGLLLVSLTVSKTWNEYFKP